MLQHGEANRGETKHILAAFIKVKMPAATGNCRAILLKFLGYSGDGSSNDGQGGYNLTMTVDPTNAAHVYVGAINLWKSTDSAKTWRQQSHWAYGVHADKHHYIFSPFNAKKVFITHDGGIDRSGDTGKSWKTITDGLTASEFYKMGKAN
jgi:hypothetical protein